MRSKRTTEPFPNPSDPLSVKQSDDPPLVKDTDISYDSPHHTIGEGPTQAASGKKVKDMEKRLAKLEAAAKLAGWTL